MRPPRLRVEEFSRALAFELGHFGIRVNVVAPSLVRSDIWIVRRDEPEAYDRMLAAVGARYPLGRTGEPADVAELIRFLVSERPIGSLAACSRSMAAARSARSSAGPDARPRRRLKQRLQQREAN